MRKNEDLKAKVNVLHLVVTNIPRGGEQYAKIKTLEPKLFDGVHRAKEQESFL